MKGTSKKWSPAGELDTPYKRASQEWDDRIGSAVVQANNWRLATFATIVFVALPSICGMIYLGAQPKRCLTLLRLVLTQRCLSGRNW